MGEEAVTPGTFPRSTHFTYYTLTQQCRTNELIFKLSIQGHFVSNQYNKVQEDSSGTAGGEV